MLPFSVTNGYTNAYGAPARTEQRYARYEHLRAVRPADFKRPEGPHDWRMIHGAHSTRIRIFVDKSVIVFNAMVNGKGPFAFVFDPGAQGVLTSEAAGPLGLTRGAMADVASVRVGDASIAHLPLPVYAGKPTDLYPERDPKRAPIAGALGPELLDRFAVRLDYGRATMTLTPLKAFVYDARGAAVRFTMQEDDDIPLILASVDGKVGRFQYDVRAPVSVLLFAPYLEKTGLGARYPSGRGKVRALSLAGTTLRDVPATFGKQRVGKFSSRTEAGLLGYRVLSKYVTTINYATRTIYFEPR